MGGKPGLVGCPSPLFTDDRRDCLLARGIGSEVPKELREALLSLMDGGLLSSCIYLYASEIDDLVAGISMGPVLSAFEAPGIGSEFPMEPALDGIFRRWLGLLGVWPKSVSSNVGMVMEKIIYNRLLFCKQEDCLEDRVVQ